MLSVLPGYDNPLGPVCNLLEDLWSFFYQTPFSLHNKLILPPLLAMAPTAWKAPPLKAKRSGIDD
jgi:hypothetical protein